MECGHRYKRNTTMCIGHSATTDYDHHTADNQLSRCCILHADWSVRNVTEYDSLLMITRSLCGHAMREISALVRLTFDLRTHKCIQLDNMLLSIKYPNMRKIR